MRVYAGTPWHSRRGFVELSEEAFSASRWAARGLTAFALAVFAVLLLERGAPRSYTEQSWEATAQYALLALLAFGSLVAWRWEGVGGWLLTSGSVALGVLASMVYHPGIALFGCLAFFVPGLLFLIHWQHHRGRPVIILTVLAMVALLSAGAVGSTRLYDYYNGPTHPESPLEARPVDIVDWVVVGAVRTDGFEVKARVPDPDDGVPELLVEAAGGHTPPVAFSAAAGPAQENSVVTYVAAGLAADTEYRYAFRRGDHLDHERVGVVRTFPDGPASFTVAFASCARTGSNGQVYDRIREANPLVYIVPGDIHYENITVPDEDRIREAWTRTITAPAQQALLLAAPLVYTWDDHDFGGDGSNGTSKAKPAVERIYREFFPHYEFAGREASGLVYQAFTIGRVRFIVTDTRAGKSPPGAAWDPGRTMLGAEQKAWLKAELLAARDSHALTVWVNSVPWIAAARDGADHWGGYAAERQEIADFIVENGITNLAMLSGDAHMLAIDDGTNNTFASTGDGPGFPVFHAAALDRRGKVKGGPYSEGTYPGGGQFGLMTVDDSGGRIAVSWSGRNWEGRELVAYSFAYEVGVTAE